MEEVQEKIVRKAGEMFFKFGIRSVTIDDICHELGISKKTFYIYFNTKDDLVEAMLHANLEYHKQIMDGWMQSRTLNGLVRQYMERLVNEQKDVRKVPQLIHDLKKYYPQQSEWFQREMREFRLSFSRRTLGVWMQDGFVRPNTNIELASLFIVNINSNAIDDIDDLVARGVNIPLFTHEAIEIILRGILTEKGLRDLFGTNNE